MRSRADSYTGGVTSHATIDYTALATQIRNWARDLGFQQTGFSDIALDRDADHLASWIESGMHGEMDYMVRHGAKRTRPDELVPGTRRVISVRMDYGSGDDEGAWEMSEQTPSKSSKAAKEKPQRDLF